MSISKMNDLTVIIPTFNRSQELIRALDSLSLQIDPDFDVIVCDDGSSENIRTVVLGYEHKLRIRYFRSEPSQGPGSARNVGIESAKTTWVSFLDSDDWWLPSRIKHIRELLVDEFDVVYHQLQVERLDKSIRAVPRHGLLMGSQIYGPDTVSAMILRGNPLATSATTVRRQLIYDVGCFNTSTCLIGVEDFECWMRLAIQGARFKFLPKALGSYFVGGSQLSTMDSLHYKRYLNLYKSFLDILPEPYNSLAQSKYSYQLGVLALRVDQAIAKDHFRQLSMLRQPLLYFKGILRLWQFKSHHFLAS